MFQRGGGVAGFSKERRNRYRLCDENVAFPLLFFLGKSRGGGTLDGDSIKKPTNLSHLIPMKKTILALALAAGLTSFAGSAKATPLTWNWSIAGDGSYGTSTDVIGGVLTLNDAGTQATSLYVTSDQGGNVHFDSSINFVNYLAPWGNNSFTVVNGKITSASFDNANYQGNPNYSVGFGYYGNNNSFNSSLYNYQSQQFTYSDTVNNSKGIDGINFTSATVPEPSTYALFGLGALALVIAYRRKVA